MEIYAGLMKSDELSQPLKNLKLSGGYCWGYAEHGTSGNTQYPPYPGGPSGGEPVGRLTGRPSMAKHRRSAG